MFEEVCDCSQVGGDESEKSKHKLKPDVIMYNSDSKHFWGAMAHLILDHFDIR